MTNVDFPYWLGVRDETKTFITGMLAVLGWFSLGPLVWAWKRHTPFMKKLGLARYGVVSFLYLCMSGVIVKILLRLIFHIKYIWVWPNVFNI
jgi:hypothetical protein